MDTHGTVVPDDMADEYGHVNYKYFPRLFEPAQDAFMEKRGAGFVEIERRWSLRSFVKKLAVTYIGQVRPGESISITTELVLGNTSMTFKQGIRPHRGSASVTAATIELVVVLVEADGTSCPIPDDLRAMLE